MWGLFSVKGKGVLNMNTKAVKTIIAASVFIILGGCHFAQNDKAAVYNLAHDNVTDDEKDDNEKWHDSVTDALSEATEAHVNMIYVQAAGAVVNPGVYEVAEGTRVYEVISAAGGTLDNADEQMLMLAGVVSDGERIYVPYEGEIITQPYDADDGMVNINTADESTLTTLPGIGAARAADIIAYRQTIGRFDTIEQIMEVPGIKEAAFNKIKNKIKV